MDLRSNEEIAPDSEHDMDFCFTKPVITCPNCQTMMNEIIELRMELGRREESERKAKKNFISLALNPFKINIIYNPYVGTNTQRIVITLQINISYK